MKTLIKNLGLGLMKAFGFGFIFKFGYKIYGRPQLIKLSKKIDPENKTDIDEEAIKKIDQVVEAL